MANPTKEEIIAQHKFLDSVGLQHVWGKVKSRIGTDATKFTVQATQDQYIKSVSVSCGDDGSLTSVEYGKGTLPVTGVTESHGLSLSNKKVTIAAAEALSGNRFPTADMVGAAVAKATTTIADKKSGHVTVSLGTATDGHKIYTISENDIASAATLNKVSSTVSEHSTAISGLRKDLGTPSTDDAGGSGSAFARIAALRAAIQGGTHWIGVKNALPTTSKNGDICSIAGWTAQSKYNGKEFIWDDSQKESTAPLYKWVELGDSTADQKRITDLENGTKPAGKANQLTNSHKFVIGGVTKSFNGAQDVTITKAEMELDKVNNTPDSEKNVASAVSATDASYAAKIGSSSGGLTVGSIARPVYVNAGTVTAIGTDLGDAAFMSKATIIAGLATTTYVDNHDWNSRDITDFNAAVKVVKVNSAASADATQAALTVGTKTFNGSEAVTITKSDLGLGSVDNTSDIQKSVKHAAHAAALCDGTNSHKLLTIGGDTTPVKFVDGVPVPVTTALVSTSRKVNNNALTSDITLDGSDIKLTGYVLGSDKSAVAATDTINAAFSKLQKQVSAADAKAGVTSVTCKKASLPTEFITSNKTTGAVELTFHHVEHTLTPEDIDTLLA